MGANISYSDGAVRPAVIGVPGSTQVAQTRPSARYTQSGEADNTTHKEKKKRLSKLTTLKKKLVRARRHSRSFDHAKVVREYTASWSIKELNALVEEYEALAVEKEIALHASLARAHARTYKDDLSTLFDSKLCTDIDLIYKGTCFPAHRAILSVRCSFFRNLLARYPDYGAQVPIQIRTAGVDLHMFSSLLRYLYTGDFHVESSKLDTVDVLVQLGNEFGIPNPVEQDLRTLLECSDYSDTLLYFTSDTDGFSGDAQSSSAKRTCRAELSCHKAILAARSPFFKSMLIRRVNSTENMADRSIRARYPIVLDECVIPKRYANILLSALYLDVVDLSQIIRTNVNTTSLSEVQAMVAGKAQISNLDEAMELYQIGQFLDFPSLSQGCEDLIIESLCLDNLVCILQWSCEAHGSSWVHRQALNYLQEEFLQVAHSNMLLDLSHTYLLQAISSDFLQAGELDVLTAVLRWGEHQLVRRMEEREPNLLSHTAHSLSKKGIRKRDLPDAELKDLLEELLPCVRTDHIIPSTHDTLLSAVRRRLLSTPPSHMLIDEGRATSPAVAWIRAAQNTGGAGVSVVYVRPRLFTPYHIETKALLEEQLSQVQENEVVRLRMVQMPDTLYMVDDAPRLASVRGCSLPVTHQIPTQMSPGSSAVDIIAGTIPVPDQQTLKALLCREHSLQHCELVQRAFGLACLDRYAVCSHIQHQVVREFGLPDSAVELLQSARLYTVNSCEDQMDPDGAGHVYSTSHAPGHVHYLHQHSTPARHIHVAQSPPQSPRILAAPHSHPVLLATTTKVPNIQQQSHKLAQFTRAISQPAPASHHQAVHIPQGAGRQGAGQCYQTGGHASTSCSPLIHSGCVHPRSPALSPAIRKNTQREFTYTTMSAPAPPMSVAAPPVNPSTFLHQGTYYSSVPHATYATSQGERYPPVPPTVPPTFPPQTEQFFPAPIEPCAARLEGHSQDTSPLHTPPHGTPLNSPPSHSTPLNSPPSHESPLNSPPPDACAVSPSAMHCAIPDIAMATSSLAQLSIQDQQPEPPPPPGGDTGPPPNVQQPSGHVGAGAGGGVSGGDLQLDLGDGNSHTNSTVYI